MTSRQALEERQAALGRLFLERTLKESGVIQEALAGDGLLGVEPLTRARALAHKMHGSGATFGFESISEAAGRLEHAVDAALAAPPASAGDCQSIRELARQLAQEVGRVAGAPRPDPAAAAS